MLDILTNDMMKALKSGQKSELKALRNLIGKIKAKQIDHAKELTNDDCIKIINFAVKQLKDSIQQYKDGNRLDLVNQESFELAIIEKYLPPKMSEDEIQNIILSIISDTNATSMKDMGKIMGIAMQKIGNNADGSIVQMIVKQELSI